MVDRYLRGSFRSSSGDPVVASTKKGHFSACHSFSDVASIWIRVGENPSSSRITPRSISLSHFLDRHPIRSAILLNRSCTGCGGECRTAPIGYREICDPLPFQLLYVSGQSPVKFCRHSIGKTGSASFALIQDAFLVSKLFAQPSSSSWHPSQIRLNVTGKNKRDEEQASRRECCYPGICVDRGYDKLLEINSSEYEKSAIVEWAELCKHLVSHIAPHQLQLCLICDVADVETAEEVLNHPSSMPILRGLTIRLGNDPKDFSLHALAKRTVYEKTNRSVATQSSPFQFGKLPRQIRLLIFEYTHLVTPFDIAWFPYRSSCGLRVFEFRDFKRRISTACFGTEGAFTRCRGKCSDAMEACCCWRQRAAYSSSCTCWQMPMPLLSASRQMQEDAMAVFFSKNHFVVLTTDDFICGRMHFETVLTHFTDRLPVGRESRSRPHAEGHRTCTATAVLAAAQLMTDSLLPLGPFKNLRIHLSCSWGASSSIYFFRLRDRKKVLEKERSLEKQIMGDEYNAELHGKYAKRHDANGYMCSEKCEECPELGPREGDRYANPY
ncbi:uncharacterized protein BP5553_10139 [Venustampulla echinocandica]|uniref:F-box domain-containing protein n=1 Tax=Venustampulla echinocandica TaxID=2656787 RepID=A0A370TAF5_9HELO|nr:uncharacterized protein BP5553_10139 [Venustampulla echinocandica]RDL30794.1 hypothetical protein BP5553_10139 [Venustampulla echinocandica]